MLQDQLQSSHGCFLANREHQCQNKFLAQNSPSVARTGHVGMRLCALLLHNASMELPMGSSNFHCKMLHEQAENICWVFCLSAVVVTPMFQNSTIMTQNGHVEKHCDVTLCTVASQCHHEPAISNVNLSLPASCYDKQTATVLCLNKLSFLTVQTDQILLERW